MITLFDVLEHFPKPQHPLVFSRIKQCSHDSTLIAITIPDAWYLDFFRKHYPERLQVVDESIPFEEIMSLFSCFNMETITYQRFGIDFENQYRFYLLNYRKETFTLEQKRNVPKPWIPDKIKMNVDRIRAHLRALKYKKILEDLNISK